MKNITVGRITQAVLNFLKGSFYDLSQLNDFILLDLSMPGMSGVEAFQEIQASGCDVPVILSSGYKEMEMKKKYGDRGFAGFIQKPYEKEGLIEMLSALKKGDGK